MSNFEDREMAPRWMVIAFIVWICAIVALAFRPLLENLDIFRQVDPKLYILILAALAASVIAATAYHLIRRSGFSPWEPSILPLLFLLLCAIYAPRGLAVALWMLAAAFALGRFATRIFRVQADVFLSWLMGLGIYSLLFFVLGISHAFYPWAFALLLAIPPLLFWKSFRDLILEFKTMRAAWLNDPDIRAPHVSIAMFAAIVLALLTTATLLTPAWNGDTVRFHLPLMRVFLSAHALTVPSVIPYGYFPQGFEVLGAAAYAFAGRPGAQFLNPAFFCIGLMLAYRIARECGIARSWAIAGVVMAASIPFLHWSGSVTKNDFPLAAYQLAALLCWFRWRDTKLFRWLAISAFFIALSFGIKHVAIFGAIPWALACLYTMWNQPKRLLHVTSLGAIVLALGLIWQARAYVGTGNPFFPLTAQEQIKGRRNRMRRARWVQFVAAPYDVHFNGKANFQSPTENPLGILLLLLAPLWLIRRARGTSWCSEALLWLFVVLYYLPWAFEAAVLRYALAPVLLLAILGVARLPLFPKPVAIAALGVALLFSLPVLVLVEMAPAQIPLFLKQINAATFLRRTLPPFGAVEFLSRRASPSDHILSIGDWAAAYAPNPANFDSLYSNRRKYSSAALNRLLKPDDRFLILPAGPDLAPLEAAIPHDRMPTRVYQDRDFVVDALQPVPR
jgi:hypothetical protein